MHRTKYEDKDLSLRCARALPFLAIFLIACGPSLIRDTNIEDTPEHREILKVVETYRSAIENRDIRDLRRVISTKYYENASTTDIDTDDYGTEQVLKQIFPVLSDHVDKVFYVIEITELTMQNNEAFVDYKFELKFHYTDGEKEHWGLKQDINRLSLEREEHGWFIVSGL